MLKPLTLLLFFFALNFCFVSNSKVVAQPPLIEEGVVSLTLSREKTASSYLIKNNPSLKRICSSDESPIVASTEAISYRSNIFSYYFFVSGGVIQKYGNKANWHLEDVKPGEYSITAGIGLNDVLWGKTVTKTVKVTPCEIDIIPCSCPSLSITGPTELAKAGDTLIFTANLSGGDQDQPIYRWTVSAGTIIVGQGTSKILVKTSKELAGQIVTATVEIGGLCSDCPQTTASASVDIAQK